MLYGNVNFVKLECGMGKGYKKDRALKIQNLVCVACKEK